MFEFEQAAGRLVSELVLATYSRVSVVKQTFLSLYYLLTRCSSKSNYVLKCRLSVPKDDFLFIVVQLWWERPRYANAGRSLSLQKSVSQK